MVELKGYCFEAPLLVTDQVLITLKKEEWQNGEKWLDTLHATKNLLGIVLPLEIKASAHQFRQDLLGVELLSWLRWSATEDIRYLPVLIAAWQPLDAILRHTLNLLLVTSGTSFLRLPEAVETLPEFIKGLCKQPDAWPKAKLEDLERIAGGNQVEQISYHDLANEFYAAHRLWEGYKYAVAKTNIKAELKRINSQTLSFADKLESKLKQPAVKEYLASRHRHANPVYYPLIDNPEKLLIKHVKKGLPNDVRILMVDDEFDKGLAEVLLEMLFKENKFSFRNQNEWVYTKENRARMVCVKNVNDATFWLNHWGEADVSNEFNLDFVEGAEGRKWIRDWADVLDCNITQSRGEGLSDISKQVFCFNTDSEKVVDRPSQSGLTLTTVILLDLYLDKRETTALFRPEQISSVRLWQAIKKENILLPIIIFTASRQTMNYSAIMNVARKSDGWLTKEGPDITLDNEQSSHASLYLLDRIHMFYCLQGWHHEELQWEGGACEDYCEAYRSPYWAEVLENINKQSTRIFNSVQEKPHPFQDNKTFMVNIDNVYRIKRFKVEKHLVRRRIAVAALLKTAKIDNANNLEWQLQDFVTFLNFEPARLILQYANNVFHFQRDLWFKSYDPRKLLGAMLKEEYQWLREIFPEQDYSVINQWLDEAESSIDWA